MKNDKNTTELMLEVTLRTALLNLETERKRCHRTVDTMFDKIKEKAAQGRYLFSDIEMDFEPKISFTEPDSIEFEKVNIKEFLEGCK